MNWRIFGYVFNTFFMGFFVLASVVHASTPVFGALSADTTWTAAASPYIVSSFSIPPGVKLTIEPGVVVKMSYPTEQFYVEGTLIANGTSDKKIYFTSFADDAVGGDTNGDGSTSSPHPGDWVEIAFTPGSTGNFSNTVLRYAGSPYSWNQSGAGIKNDGGAISISNSKISDNLLYGIFHYAGSTNILFSELANNGNEGAFTYMGSFTVSQSSIHDNPLFGIQNLGTSTVMAENNWWGSASGPHNPIFNPLGFGQEVSLGVDFTPWLGFDPINVPPPPAGGPDPIIIIPGILGSAEKNGVWVIDPIFHTYDDLIQTLEANGYTDGVDLFTFPYDWHQSNVLTALQLKDKINAVKVICQCQKVDIVAHSMGGLVARQYIQSLHYENDVDQLIFLGTPHLGSTFSYLTWEGGEFGTKTGPLGAQIRDLFAKMVFTREAQKAGYLSIFEYVRRKPIISVQELLPIYDYLRDKSTGNLRIYPNNYPQNSFLVNLDSNVGTLMNSGIRVTNITGDLGATSTLNIIRVVNSPNPPFWENGYPDGYDGSTADRGFEFANGDGTVPKNSSEFIVSDLHEFVSGHNALVTDAEGMIYTKLTGKETTLLVHSASNIPNLKMLFIKLLSPVDMQIIAPDGKRIGKDFGTGGEFNEIDGAFYSGFQTDDEYITIPNPLDGEYQVKTVGTGSGDYTVATGYISDNVSVDKDFTGQTLPGLSENLNLEINNNIPTALQIVPQDVTPPAISIISPKAQDYLRSAILPVNVSIQDTDTGLASSTILFDGKIISASTTVDLFFEKLGIHKVSVLAADFVGNAASTTLNFRVMATLQSTISDIDRAYALGWISKKNVHDSLVSKLQDLIGQSKAVTQKTLKSFLATFDKNYPTYINDQARALIKEDVNWMLNN